MSRVEPPRGAIRAAQAVPIASLASAGAGAMHSVPTYFLARLLVANTTAPDTAHIGGIDLHHVLVATLVAAIVGVLLYARWLHRSHHLLKHSLSSQVAEHKQTSQALEETEVFYHALVETLPQSIFRKDIEGRFTFANNRFCKELGRSLDSILYRTDFDFFPAPLAEKYREDDRRVMASGQVLDVVEEHVTPGGETLYVQVMKIPVQGPDGKPIGIQGIFWDVTARKRAEEQLQERNRTLQELAESEHKAHEDLKKAQSRLVQSEKLASLGQMVAGVAHEINNPLAFVSNNVAVLDRDLAELRKLVELYRQAEPLIEASRPELVAEIRELTQRCDLDYTIENLPGIINRTREGLRRIQRIVSDLRLFARIDESDLNEVDLNAGVDSSLTIIEGLAKKRGVTLVRQLESLPTIRCYAAKINQVILNLLSNAIDACDLGGQVTVRTRGEEHSVVMEVQDTGSGIDPKIRDRIFDPFFTTKPVGQGTGLGLSISYGIVQDHGGTIEVESEPGRGTCFRVHLPDQPARQGALAARAVSR